MSMNNINDASLPTLIGCPVCNGKVSNDARACPHCGHPLGDLQGTANQAKGHIDNATTFLKSSTKNATKILLNIIVIIIRFCVWFVVASIFGMVGHGVSEVCIDKSYLACILLVLIYPAIITSPVVGLAKPLVCNRFSKILSYCFALFYPLATVRIFVSSFGTEYTIVDIVLQIIGVFISFLWSVRFVSHKNQTKIERILKWTLIVFNLVVVIAYLIIAIWG